MKKEFKILVLLFMLALIIRIIFVFISPVKIWDETVYANLGYDLSRNLFDYSFANNGWSDYIPDDSWPKAGFRAPLLPYILSIFYLLKIDFLVPFFISFIGALSVILIYIFGRKLFNEKVALYSSLFFTFIPLHVVYSGKILTDVFFTFFVLLTFISFWKGYEENNKKHKILFGFFLVLSLLSRYTALWLIPVFFVYLSIRYKSVKFLKDKYLWFSAGIFLIVLIPWLIYSLYTYGNPIGVFIHGAKAASFWGGVQPWYFYFQYFWNIFSVIGLIFIFSLISILYKKDFDKKQIYLLLLWIGFFFFMTSAMPHKEERLLIPILPAFCLLVGFFVDKIKKYKKLVFGGVVILLLFFLSFDFYINYKNVYTDTNLCFLKGNEFLKDIDKNSLVITDESSIVYYYTKKETHFYLNPWNLEFLKDLVKESYKNKTVYIFFTDYDMPLNNERYVKIKEDLDNNFEIVFNCKSKSFIYKIQ